MRRAAISIASNLADGTARNTSKDRAYFTQIAFSGLMEPVYQMIITRDPEYVSDSAIQHFRIQPDGLSNKMNALRKSQLKTLVEPN